MTASALALILAAAVVHATWNVLAKRAHPESSVAFVWLCSAISALAYVPVVAVLFVVAPPRPFGALGIAFAAGTALIHLVYFVLLQRGYREGDLSLVYPLARGTGPLLASAVAVAFFGERPSHLAAAGIACVVAGIFLSAGSARGERRAIVSAAYGIGAGASIAAFTLWDKHAVSALAFSPILYDFSRIVLQTLCMAPLAFARDRTAIARTWRSCAREAIGVAVLSPLAYVLILFALVHAPVSLVAPAREISIVFGTLLGARLFGEAALRRRIVAAVLMLAGIAAIAHG
ncbi:MAG TPA: DMT family transporter [Candidatus Baltobacteraceae bacterium]|nr:DMT family transporter [Candidatus Baltobacteraceae bacterium]